MFECRVSWIRHAKIHNEAHNRRQYLASLLVRLCNRAGGYKSSRRLETTAILDTSFVFFVKMRLSAAVGILLASSALAGVVKRQTPFADGQPIDGKGKGAPILGTFSADPEGLNRLC